MKFRLADLTNDELIARFWANVQKGDGCWEWLGGRHSDGYGQTHLRLAIGSFVTPPGMPHRTAYMLTHGGPIPSGLCVDHTCHNRLCCNPAHMQLLTHSENSRRKWWHVMSEAPVIKQPRIYKQWNLDRGVGEVVKYACGPGQKVREASISSEKVRQIDHLRSLGVICAKACEKVGVPKLSYYKFKQRGRSLEKSESTRTTPDQQGDAA